MKLEYLPFYLALAIGVIAVIVTLFIHFHEEMIKGLVILTGIWLIVFGVPRIFRVLSRWYVRLILSMVWGDIDTADVYLRREDKLFSDQSLRAPESERIILSHLKQDNVRYITFNFKRSSFTIRGNHIGIVLDTYKRKKPELFV